MLNTSLIYLSLKYINENYESISNISKWIYSELEKYNYKESKFIKSLNDKDIEVIKTLVKFNENKDLISKHLITFCSCTEDYFEIVKLFIENGANVNIEDDSPLLYAAILKLLKQSKLSILIRLS